MATYKFGVRDAKIATRTGSGTYSALVDLTAVSSVEITIQTTNAQLEGDDEVVDYAVVSTGAQVRIRFGAGQYTIEAYNLLTGVTPTSSGSDRKIAFGGDPYPYLGFIAQVYESNGTGDNHLFLPKVKLQDGFTYNAAYGSYVQPDINLMGLPDGAFKIFQIVEHATATALVMPPAF